MKKLFALLAIAFATSLSAQTYSISPANTVTFSAPYNNITINDIYMDCTSNSTLSITWGLISMSLPVGWDYSMCELGTCHTGIPTGPTTMSTHAVGGAQAFLGLNIDPNSIPGTGVVKVKVYRTGSFGNVDTLTWYINSVVAGVHELSLNGNVKVFPNPAKEKISLKNNLPGEITAVSMTDISGRKMEGIKLENDQIDISNLNSGIYFLQISTSHGKCVQKIVKE
jgi:hypothetical protein